VRRESILIYLDRIPAAPIAPILERGVLVGEIRPGGVRAAIEQAPSWRVVPAFLVLDVSGVEDVAGAVATLSQVAPQGETSLILLGETDCVAEYRRMIEAGASEYLPIPVDADVLYEAVVRLAGQRAAGQVDPARCVAFIGARGGMGTSTLAAAAAKVAAQEHGRRILLVDLDVVEGAQHVIFDVDQTPALQQMLETPDRLDGVFLDRSMAEAGKGLFLLSMTDMGSAKVFTAEAVAAIVRQAQQGMDLVVLDLPARPQVEIEALFCAGTVFLVTTPTLLGLRDAGALVDWLSSRSFPGKIVCVLNRMGETRAGAVRKEQFERRLRCRVVELPFDPRTPGQAMMEKRTVGEIKGPLGRAFRQIEEELPTFRKAEGGFLSRLLKGD
jgi:pilus assembly protein CpaE